MQTSKKYSASAAALNAKFVACRACDALWLRPTLAPGERARCPRCRSTILANKPHSAERIVALLLASLPLYLLVVSFPFLRMQASGLGNQISVIDAVGVLWTSKHELLAVLCFLLILALPLMRIVFSLIVGLRLMSSNAITLRFRRLFGAAQSLAPWSMLEIFMLGVVVSLVKIGAMADIEVGVAFWALAALTITMSLGLSAVCADTLWTRARSDL